MVYIGKFTEKEIKEGKEKIIIEEKKKETGLKYVKSKILYKNKKPFAIEFWLCTVHEFNI